MEPILKDPKLEIPSKSDVTIVIVSYYRGDRLKRCLDTLDNSFPVIVWDNNTTGEELNKVKIAEKSHPNVNFTYNKENVGLVKAWNMGIIHSKTDWVLLTCDDMLFDKDWFDVFTSILKEKPHLEQVHLNSFNCLVLHKKTIVRMGWWDERYRYYPSMEDDDWYLRTVEILGYSPYGGFPKHLSFPEGYKESLKEEINLKKYYFNKEDNFTYFCNSEYSPYKIIGKSTTTGGGEDAGSRNNSVGSMDRGNNMTGIEFHHLKWKIVDPRLESVKKDSILLGKDGRCWKRIQHDLDFYPDIRNKYAKKYFNINLYEDINNTTK
jgi:glycosyltransferase involved in cell wall biosynthesis